MSKSQYKHKRDKNNLQDGTVKTSYRPIKAKKRNKSNLDQPILKSIVPICPLGGKCIQPAEMGSKIFDPNNCKKCSRMSFIY